MPTFAIGVDLGGTNLRIAAVDERGTLLEKTTTGTQVARGRDYVINEMCEAIRATAAKFSSSTLAGIGIGVPGIIDMDTGMLRESPNLPGWHDYPVRDEIERRLGTKVILENDANAAALGEKWLGAARDYDDMLMLTLGTGVGGGIVLGGRIWHGMRGMAGEPGHITVEPEGPPCPCGNRGCLEQFASATAVLRMAREAIALGNAPTLARSAEENVEFGANVVYQMAVQGDSVAQRIFQRVGWALGIGLADLINLLNLPIYVIGGGVANAWEAFLPVLLEEVRKRSFVYRATAPEESSGSGKKTIITRALLGSDAGLFGAARLPMLPAEVTTHEFGRKRA
ncbi:MAG TPA: ROK family protein [Terriglobales bacterium]|nr:ROK family protein [Terriglobales bacterium]